MGYRSDFLPNAPVEQLIQPRPIRFSSAERLLIDAEVDKLVAKGAAVEVPEHWRRSLWLSRIFLVPKKSGELRPIINLQPLNKFLHYEHFKMEGLFMLKDLLHPGDFMATIDMKDAYFGIPLAVEHQRFVAFEWRQRLYQCPCIMFGLSSSPRVYSKCMQPVAAHLCHLGVRLIVFLDDWCFLNQSVSGLEWDLAMACQLFSSLGLVVNIEKSVLQPSQQIKYLGLIIDSVQMALFVPEDKLVQIEQQCCLMQKATHVSVLLLVGLLGHLTSVSQAVFPSALYSRNLQRLLAEHVRRTHGYNGVLVLDKASRKELSLWSAQLRFWNGRSILPKEPDVTLTSDASNVGWGGWHNDRLTGGRWMGAELLKHINYKEFLASFLTLQSFLRESQNLHILMQLDNSTAIAYINRQGGRHSVDLSDLAVQIWEWCLERQCTVHAIHLLGVDNRLADAESRTMRDKSDWMLSPVVTKMLFRRFGQCLINLFASQTNAQLPTFFAWRPDPTAKAIDAFDQSWSVGCVYAFPPFCLISRTLQKAAMEQAELLLIVPVWPAQAWWPSLLEMAVDQPVLLRPSTTLLTDLSGTSHPLCDNGNLRLSAWRISGLVGAARDFQRTLLAFSPLPGLSGLASSTILPSKSGIAGVCRNKLIRFHQM